MDVQAHLASVLLKIFETNIVNTNSTFVKLWYNFQNEKKKNLRQFFF